MLLPVNGLTLEIKVLIDNALHAYKPLLPAVKTGQPHIIKERMPQSSDHHGYSRNGTTQQAATHHVRHKNREKV